MTENRSTYHVRWAAVLATGLLTVIGQSATAANKNASCSASLDDASGDVALATIVNGQPTQLVPTDNPNVDLTKVTISRDARSVRVVFQVTKLAVSDPSGPPLGAWNLTFTAGGHRYDVHTAGDNPIVNAGTYHGWGGFHALRDDKQVRGATGRFDTTTNTVVVEWPDRGVHGALSRVQADTNMVLFNGGTGPAIARLQQQDVATGSGLALGC